MSAVREVGRFATAGAEPMGLAFDETSLWIACREAHRIFAVDPASGAVRTEAATPGAPFGIAFMNDVLYVIVGRGHDDDDRYLHRYTRARGFENDSVACPDRSGAHLASFDETLYLSQAHNRKIISLDRHGAVITELQLDRLPLGMTYVDNSLYLISGDRSFRDLQLGRLVAGDAGQRRLIPIASVPFKARGLAFRAGRFWTADANDNEVVTFELPTTR